MDVYILSLAKELGVWLYALIFLATFVEATVTLFAVAFLITAGAVPALPGVAVVLGGCFVEDLLWFWVGLHVRRLPTVSRWVDRITGQFDAHFNGRLFRTLLISKFIYGAHRAVVARAGMLAVPLSRYARAAFLAMAIWFAVILGLAFGVSVSYQAMKDYVRYAELIILGVVVAVFVVEYVFSKYFRKEM